MGYKRVRGPESSHEWDGAVNVRSGRRKRIDVKMNDDKGRIQSMKQHNHERVWLKWENGNDLWR